MSNILSNRADAIGEIRRLSGDDPWLLRYALLKALERSDLLVVNQVLEALEEATAGVGANPGGLLAKLREERWG